MGDRIPKDALEQRVAKDLLNALCLGDVESLESRPPPEPDVLAKIGTRRIGIELCALLNEAEIKAGAEEAQFLDGVNGAIDPMALQAQHVGLVMQDDAGTVIHKPAPGFVGYTLLPAYLDALLVVRLPPVDPKRKVRLSQRSSDRPAKGLFPPRKEVQPFAAELCRYVSGLRDSDFLKTNKHPPVHHAVVAVKAGDRPPVATDRMSALDGKLSGKKKYNSTHCNDLWLVVHNLPQRPETNTFHWHEYWYHKDQILEFLRGKLKDLSLGPRGPLPFNSVYFADFSEFLGGCTVHKLDG